MREIKFRAWDGEKLYSPTLEDGKVFRNGRAYEDYIPSSDPLMQYTGLKDKNGVEIYEGDILKPSMSGAKPFEVKYKTEAVGVNGGHGENYSDLFSGFKITGYYGNPADCVVIGNIYENPELLQS